MDITNRRYQTPATRPTLVTHSTSALEAQTAPVVSLSRTAAGGLGGGRSYVTFRWSGLTPSLSRR